MMRKILMVAVAAGLAGAMACGGDSDSVTTDTGETAVTNALEPGGLDTGLPEATPLQNLSAEQYTSACETLRQNVSQRLGPDVATRGVCEAYGAGLANDPSACQSQADTCVSQANAGTSPLFSREQVDFTRFECGDVGQLQGCSVTVGEYEICLEDRMSAFEALMAENNCANAASVSLTQALALQSRIQASPPSCARVEQECPGVGPFGAL